MKYIRVYHEDSDITMFADEIIANKESMAGLNNGSPVFIIDSAKAVILEQYRDIASINLGIGSRCIA